jgi:hypothetical protein
MGCNSGVLLKKDTRKLCDVAKNIVMIGCFFATMARMSHCMAISLSSNGRGHPS